MIDEPSVEVAAITDTDVSEVAEFLHANLNEGVSAAAWARAVVPPWPVDAPNHGFLLRAGDRIVGVYLAIYSDRVIAGEARRFCNLAAWCVLDAFRAHSIRLVRAVLRQPDMEFTDLSPSGNVVALNHRLGFTSLDTTTALVPNLPWRGRTGGARVLARREDIEAALDPASLQIYRDHETAAAVIHLVLETTSGSCYVMARKDRRKGLPLFASIVHVSDPAVFEQAGSAVFGHLLLHHAALVTLAELRVVGRRPRISRIQRNPRPKMFRSRAVPAGAVDYLYSELTCVSW